MIDGLLLLFMLVGIPVGIILFLACLIILIEYSNSFYISDECKKLLKFMQSATAKWTIHKKYYIKAKMPYEEIVGGSIFTVWHEIKVNVNSGRVYLESAEMSMTGAGDWQAIGKEADLIRDKIKKEMAVVFEKGLSIY